MNDIEELNYIANRLRLIHENLGEHFIKHYLKLSERSYLSMIQDAKDGKNIYVAGGSGIVRVHYLSGQIMDGYWMVDRKLKEQIVDNIMDK